MFCFQQNSFTTIHPKPDNTFKFVPPPGVHSTGPSLSLSENNIVCVCVCVCVSSIFKTTSIFQSCACIPMCVLEVTSQTMFRGCQNGAFGKRSFCLGDTRHFRHFRRFPGLTSKIPCFMGRMHYQNFADFRQNHNHLFSARGKSTVFQNDHFDNPDHVASTVQTSSEPLYE